MVLVSVCHCCWTKQRDFCCKYGKYGIIVFVSVLIASFLGWIIWLELRTPTCSQEKVWVDGLGKCACPADKPWNVELNKCY